MKNIIKATLVLLASVAVSTVTYAGDLAVTGTAKATFGFQSSDNVAAGTDGDKGIGIANEIDFTASGEMDNGFTWKYQVQFDPGATTTAGNGAVDDSRLEIGTSYGTIGIYNTEGGLGQEFGHAAGAAYGAALDSGDDQGLINDLDISAYSNIQYHTPSGLLPLNTSFKVAYAPSDDTTINSSNARGSAIGTGFSDITQYQIKTSPIDGLNIFADYIDFTSAKHVTSHESEGGSYGATFAYGPVTIGAVKTARQNAFDAVNDTLAATDIESAITHQAAIGFAVNDDLSISYSRYKSQQKLLDSLVDQRNANEALMGESYQAAYSVGGMTLGISRDLVENADYTINKDEKETLASIKIAF
jgi:hypothetical protein